MHQWFCQGRGYGRMDVLSGKGLGMHPCINTFAQTRATRCKRVPHGWFCLGKEDCENLCVKLLVSKERKPGPISIHGFRIT